jgi:hypothetical protein
MQRSLSSHIGRLEKRITQLRSEIEHAADSDIRNALETDFQATRLALAHCHAAWEIENRIMPDRLRTASWRFFSQLRYPVLIPIALSTRHEERGPPPLQDVEPFRTGAPIRKTASVNGDSFCRVARQTFGPLTFSYREACSKSAINNFQVVIEWSETTQ